VTLPSVIWRNISKPKFVRDPHYFKKILEQISRVRSSDVQRVAKEHLHPESMIVVAVGDTTKIESDLSKLNLGPLRCVREGR
jgi:hypothetical protein